jgi:leucine dehydrogenase
VRRIGERLDSIFAESVAEGRSPSDIADHQAEAIIYGD